MRVFILQDSLVLVGQVMVMGADREEIRAGLRHSFQAKAVWFDDELGTEHDPINGSNPTIRRTLNFRNN